MTNLKQIATGLAACAAAASVQAQPPIIVEGNPTVTVSYADLNLASPSGVSKLNGRVRRAAEQLCVDEAVRDLARTAVARQCLTSTLVHAQGQMERAIADSGNAQFAGRSTITLAGR